MLVPDFKAVAFISGLFVISTVFHLILSEENNGVILSRHKRQFELEQGNQLIDSIFQIPIQTLNAVSNLWKTTRPITYRIRQQVLNQYQQYASRPSYSPSFGPSYSFTNQRPAFQRPGVYPRKTEEKKKKKSTEDV